jgi:hypothetical protein
MDDKKDEPVLTIEQQCVQMSEKLSNLWGKVDRYFTDLKPLAEVLTVYKGNEKGSKYNYVLRQVGNGGWSVCWIDPNNLNNRPPVGDVKDLAIKLDAIKAIKGLSDLVKSKNAQVYAQLKEAVAELEAYLKNPDES